METISRNIEDLVAFHAVASEGSFTRAADSLRTSKAMLSKQVRRLEATVRAQLFQRTTRRLSLTEQGLALFQYSQKIFHLSDEASRRIMDMSQGASGVLRISAPVSLGEAIMPDLLVKVREALPRVRFELDLSNENRDFSRDGIDFALRADDTHDPDHIARYLGKIRDVICISPSLLKTVKIKDLRKDLARNPCILHLLDDQWNNWASTSKKEEEILVRVQGSYSTNQYPMARLLCLKGLGIARIPYYMVADDLTSGDLVQIFPEYEIATHPLYLVYLRKEYATKKHQLMRDFILHWFEENKSFFVSQA